MKKLASLLMIPVLVLSLMSCGMNDEKVVPDESIAESEEGENIPYEPALLKMGLGIVTSAEGTVSADEKNMGRVKTNTVVCAVAVDPDGVIRKVRFDTLKYDLPFDSKGLLDYDLTNPVKTFREMGYDLGLAENSETKKEWFQQMDYFENYIVGKKMTDVLNMELDDNYIPMVSELEGLMDISVSDQLVALNKAYTNAI